MPYPFLVVSFLPELATPILRSGRWSIGLHFAFNEPVEKVGFLKSAFAASAKDDHLVSVGLFSSPNSVLPSIKVLFRCYSTQFQPLNPFKQTPDQIDAPSIDCAPYRRAATECLLFPSPEG